MKRLLEIFPILKHPYICFFFKKNYITHQIQSSFARRVSSPTLFLWQIYYKSKTFFSSLEFHPIFPADRSWALRNIGGRKHWISLHVFDKEWHSIMLLKMITGQQQNKDFYDGGEVSARLHTGYVTCSFLPSKKHKTETKYQTSSPFVPLKPLCDSHSPLHR